MSGAPFVDERLFAPSITDVAGPRLVGSRCTGCGTTTFPTQGSCPRCLSQDVEPDPLPRGGTLWSWTIQRFSPKPPYAGHDDFEPYGVGYVELGGRVLVEGRLTVAEPEKLKIGMPVELTTQELGSGDERITVFAFAPAQEASP